MRNERKKDTHGFTNVHTTCIKTRTYFVYVRVQAGLIDDIY